MSEWVPIEWNDSTRLNGWTLIGETVMNVLPVIKQPEPILVISRFEHRRRLVIMKRLMQNLAGHPRRFGRALHRARRRKSIKGLDTLLPRS